MLSLPKHCPYSTLTSPSSLLHLPHSPSTIRPPAPLHPSPPTAASTAPTVVPPVRQEEAVVVVLAEVVVVEVPNHTHPPPPPPPPIGTAAACSTSLCRRGASRHTASAASPPTTRVSCPRMLISTPSPRHPCPRTSRARCKCLKHTHLYVQHFWFTLAINQNYLSWEKRWISLLHTQCSHEDRLLYVHLNQLTRCCVFLSMFL